MNTDKLCNTSRIAATGIFLVTSLLLGASAHAEVVDGSHWMVRSGDSVYSIARQMFPDDAAKQARLRRELVDANPDIFQGNANLMSVGSKLKLPEFATREPPASNKTQPEIRTEPAPQSPAKIETQQPTTDVAGDPQDVIGRVLVTVGELEASNRGSTRKLKRHSRILKGDTLSTSTRARTQIRMKDGALISMQPNSQLKLAEYRYDGREDGSERSILELLKGGFRTITGAIGHRNRKNYQVKTAVATIGIRGTHYGLMLCSAGSCGAANNLEDGLYGGVVDGSIITENETGMRQFGNDQYFHIQSSRTRPQEILMPPPVFEDVTPVTLASDEEQEEQTAPVATTEGSEETTPEQTTDETQPARRVVEEQRRIQRLPDFGQDDFEREQIRPILTPDQEQTTETTYTPPPIVRAPLGSGMMVGFNLLGTNTAGQLGIGAVGAPVVVPGPYGNNTIYLADAQFSGNILSRIPVGGHEDSIGPDGTLQGHDLSMERPDGTRATLVAFNRDTNLGVIWGRWQGPFVVLENGQQLEHMGHLHFMYSENLTPLTNLGGITARSQIYRTAGGTRPTDDAGNIGLSVANVWAGFDFINQRMTNYSVNTTVAGNAYSGQLENPVPFNQLGDAFLISDPSGCGGIGCEGEAGLLFVGGGAEGAITSFGITNLDHTRGISGTALLTPSTATQAPNGSGALYAFNHGASNGIFTGAIRTAAGSSDNLYMTVYNDGTSNHFIPSTMLQTRPETLPSQFTGRQLLFNTASGPADFGSATSVNDRFGSPVPVTVNWGRWNATDAQVIEDANPIAHNDVHFIHSRNLTPITALTDGSLALVYGAATINYTSVGGSLPTDSLGGVGTGFATVDMNVNFSQQEITAFSVSANTGNAGYFVEMAAPVAFADLSNGIPLVEPPTVSCATGTQACTGTALLNFIGPEAEGAITSYVIGEPDGSMTISGTALLSQ